MLVKLILTNVQKHSLLELDFKKGLNIICGKTESGKTAIFRAIRFLFFADFDPETLRKYNTKKTSVLAIFDNGTSVERIKSNSVNAYILQEAGQEEKRFDAAGKTVPEEIQKVFGMNLFEVDKVKINLNIVNQLASPFLIGEEYTSTFRAKIFNQLTGNDLQDKLFKKLNKELLSTNRFLDNIIEQNENLYKELEINKLEQTKISDKHTNLENSLAYLTDLEESKQSYLKLFQRFTENSQLVLQIIHDLKSTLTLSEKDLHQINEKIALIKVLKLIQDRYHKLLESKKVIVDELSKIKVLEGNIGPLGEKIKDLKLLSDLSYRNSDIYVKKVAVENNIIKLRHLPLQQEYFYGILNKIETYKILREKLTPITEDKIKGSIQLNKLKDEIENNEITLKELKKNFVICPLCDKAIMKDELIKLGALNNDTNS